MREIKFRAWDKKAKQWRRVSDIGWYHANTTKTGISGVVVTLDYGRDQFLPIEDVELVEYTGLNDKNGEEVYEGDVLRLQMPQETIDDLPALDERHQVVFADGAFSFEDGMGIGNFSDFVEVIGNIYENPTLLTSEDKKI